MTHKALLKIGEELEQGNIDFSYVEDKIHLNLPNEFGVLEISIWRDDEDSIQLLGGNFHTHGDLEAVEYDTTREKAIRLLVESIQSGKLLLVEEYFNPEKPEKRILEPQFLPKDCEYKIYNEI